MGYRPPTIEEASGEFGCPRLQIQNGQDSLVEPTILPSEADRLNSLPVRVDVPVLADSLKGVLPVHWNGERQTNRVFCCSLLPLTPFTVVRPPRK